MHGPINVKSPNNISKWQMGFNSAFKGLKHCRSRVGDDTDKVADRFVHVQFALGYTAYVRLATSTLYLQLQ
jgi:hypothetical protein